MIDDRLRWTRASLVVEATKCLELAKIGDARRNVEWILCELLECDRASLYGYPESAVPETILPRFRRMLERRLSHEPLQYILGYTEFCGLRMDLTPDVLIPRPETEMLVEHVTSFLDTKNHPTALDVGTGSGCIAVAIKHFNGHATVFACDVSRPALDVASSNAVRAGADVSFFQCDVLSGTLSIREPERFDLIVSNPPYIPTAEYTHLDTEVVGFEPRLALDAGEDPLLFYRVISQIAAGRLETGGRVLFEIHSDYGGEVMQLLNKLGFAETGVFQDLTGLDRIVSAVWNGP